MLVIIIFFLILAIIKRLEFRPLAPRTGRKSGPKTGFQTKAVKEIQLGRFLLKQTMLYALNITIGNPLSILKEF